MADRFPLILNTSANQIQEIGSGDQLDLSGNNIANAGIITAGNVTIGAATTDLIVNGDARITGILTIGTSSLKLDGPNNLVNVGTALTLGHSQGLQFHTQNLHSAGFEVNQINVSGASTIGGNLDANGDLDVDGHTNLDNLSVAGVSTFAGNINGKDIILTDTTPAISFIDSNANSDYRIIADNGVLSFADITNNANRINLFSNGTVSVQQHVDVGAGVDVTGNITATGNVSGVDGTFSGNVSIGGTLTYEDVSNIDSVGIVTAREGIQIPNDTYKLRSGAQLEMQVWHDGTNSIIKDTRDAGKVRIQADNFDIIDKDASTTVFSAAPGGINSPKLHTFSAGVNCTSTSAGAHQFATSGTPTTFAVTGQAEVTIGGGATKDNALAIESNTTAGLDYDSNIVLARSRGSHASKGIVQSGDFLGRVGFYGYDGSEYERAAEIAAIIDGTPGTNDMPTRLEFKTTPDGANVPTTKLKIAKTGNIHLPIDNQKLYFGADLDLEILHSGTTGVIDNNTGDLYIKTTGSGDDIIINSADDINLMVQNGEQAIAAYGNGAVELYHDNLRKLETFGSGIIVYGPEGGGGLVNIYADEGDDNADKWRLHANPNGSFYLQNYSQGSWHNNISGAGGGDSTLYFNNTPKLITEQGGINVKSPGSDWNNIERTSNGYYGFAFRKEDGSNFNGYLGFTGGGSEINNTSAAQDMVIRSETNIILSKGYSTRLLKTDSNGAVSLYYGNGEKFKTNASGIEFEKCILGGSIRTPAESSITYHQSFDPAAIFYPEGSYGNNNSPSNNRHAVIIGTTKGNWVDGNSSASHRSVGIKFSRIVNSTEYIRAGIAHDINSSEKYKIWTSYGDIHFRTRNGNNGNQTWEECDRDPLVMHHNGHVSMCHMPRTIWNVSQSASSYSGNTTEYTYTGGSATDSNGMVTNTGAGTITVPYTGVYQICMNIGLHSNTNTNQRLNLKINGNNYQRTESQETGWCTHTITHCILLAANDALSFTCVGRTDGGDYAKMSVVMLHGTLTT